MRQPAAVDGGAESEVVVDIPAQLRAVSAVLQRPGAAKAEQNHTGTACWTVAAATRIDFAVYERLVVAVATAGQYWH